MLSSMWEYQECPIVLMTGWTDGVPAILHCQNFAFFFFRSIIILWTSHLDSTNHIMDRYVFNFMNVTFNPTGDSSCKTPPAFSSYDYQNLSHQPFPPSSVQLAPQPLIPPDSSYGYPVLDPALLSISNPQPISSLPSPAVQVMTSLHGVPTSTATGEHQPTISSSNTSSAHYPALDPALLSILDP